MLYRYRCTNNEEKASIVRSNNAELPSKWKQNETHCNVEHAVSWFRVLADSTCPQTVRATRDISKLVCLLDPGKTMGNEIDVRNVHFISTSLKFMNKNFGEFQFLKIQWLENFINFLVSSFTWLRKKNLIVYCAPMRRCSEMQMKWLYRSESCIFQHIFLS